MFSLASDTCEMFCPPGRILRHAKEGQTSRTLANKTTPITSSMDSLSVLPTGNDVWKAGVQSTMKEITFNKVVILA